MVGDMDLNETADTATPEPVPEGAVEVVAPGPQGEGEGEAIHHPAKVLRIGSMIKQLLEEVRAAPLDEASRSRLREVYEESVQALSEGLSPDLREELGRLALPFAEGTPSESELRVAQASLVGWLEGLFQGIQATLFAQQMAARAQLQEIRHPGLPPGPGPGPGQPPQQEPAGPTGTYL